MPSDNGNGQAADKAQDRAQQEFIADAIKSAQIEMNLDGPIPLQVEVEQFQGPQGIMVRITFIWVNTKVKVWMNGEAAVDFAKNIQQLGQASKSGLILTHKQP